MSQILFCVLLFGVGAFLMGYAGYRAKEIYKEWPSSSTKTEIVSKKNVDISLNTIRIYLIEIAKDIYQTGIVCEIANLDEKAHLLKEVGFNGDAFDMKPINLYYTRKIHLQENRIAGKIVGENFIEPYKNRNFQILLPLKFELTVEYPPPFELIFWGEWDIVIEGTTISSVPEFYGNYSKILTIEEWDKLLLSSSTIDYKDVVLMAPPIPFKSIEKYYNFMLFNSDRTADINIYGYTKSRVVKGDKGVLLFLRGPSEPSLSGGWRILGNSYPEVWSDPQKLALYNSIFPPDENAEPKPFGVFAGCFEEMGAKGSAVTTVGEIITRVKGLKEKALGSRKPLPVDRIESTKGGYMRLQ
jgi:hypothetical protein